MNRESPQNFEIERSFQRSYEAYMLSIQPYMVAITKIHELFFKGYLVNHETREITTLYHDGYELALKPYNEAIDGLKEHYFANFKLNTL